MERDTWACLLNGDGDFSVSNETRHAGTDNNISEYETNESPEEELNGRKFATVSTGGVRVCACVHVCVCVRWIQMGLFL